MTYEEYNMYQEKIHKGMEMVLEKAEAIGKAEEKWSVDELMVMSDIVKDMSETLKNLTKTHHMLSEHSIKRY